MADLSVGDAVRVLRGIRKDYRVHTFTVREIRGAEVRVDNGHPSIFDMRRNGFNVAALLRRSEVEPWQGETYLTQSAILAERISAQAAEIVRLQDALAAAGVEATRA